jgi:uncharacterized oligopeptide transporter (OPT) family protein
MVQVKSPMLFAVGMYLPFATTFAIFVGGLTKWLSDTVRDRQNFNEAQRARVENVGVLVASGLIAGEAMVGLLVATFNFFNIQLPVIFENPPLIFGIVAMIVVLGVMVRVPLANPGRPDEPAPPTAIM